jgi:hypothetical protein
MTKELGAVDTGAWSDDRGMTLGAWLDQWLDELAASGRAVNTVTKVGRRTEQRSPSTIESYRKTTRAALSAAQRRELITLSPALGRLDSIPRVTADTDDDLTVWQPEETRAVPRTRAGRSSVSSLRAGRLRRSAPRRAVRHAMGGHRRGRGRPDGAADDHLGYAQAGKPGAGRVPCLRRGDCSRRPSPAWGADGFPSPHPPSTR